MKKTKNALVSCLAVAIMLTCAATPLSAKESSIDLLLKQLQTTIHIYQN
ncbi:MAG: hypothetical protein RR916_07400 [Anaerorhabdus sp.]